MAAHSKANLPYIKQFRQKVRMMGGHIKAHADNLSLSLAVSYLDEVEKGKLAEAIAHLRESEAVLADLERRTDAAVRILEKF